MKNTHHFGRSKSNSRSSITTIVVLLLLSVFVGVTLAFFANSDFATSLLGMSGKVRIEAVGKGDKSIEDNATCNLEIELDKEYGVLIPNMPITIYANCKVKKSTTKPLLRAKFQVTIFDNNGNPYEEKDGNNLAMDIFGDINNLVLSNANWSLYTDGYYYYINTLDTSTLGNSVLEEIDATSQDTIINFLNGDTFRIPSYIEDDYSGLSIKIKIVFQAIQNYIPDDDGYKLPNTIVNSLKIFNEFEDKLYESSPISWFGITTTSDGQVSLSTKTGFNYPENLRLPEKTADGRTITHLSSDLFKGNNTVKRVYIPNTYTSIDSSSFKESGLLMVDMSDTQITEIPDSAFIRSNINKIIFPRCLIKIGKEAFQSCYLLNNVNFPNTLQTIDYAAFNACRTMNIIGEIPASVTTIGIKAFSACPLLQISVAEANPNFYDIEDRVLLSNSGRLLMYANRNKATVLTIPDSITTIDSMAIYNSIYLTKIIFGKNLKSIDNIPDSVTDIDVGTNPNFIGETDAYNNTYLIQKSNFALIWGNINNSATTLDLPDSIVRIDTVCMCPVTNRRNITKINFGSGFRYNSFSLGSFRNLTSVEVDNGNQYFKTLTGKELISKDGKTFCGIATSLTGTYTVPSTINSIYCQAFSNSKLNTVVLPDSITNIDDSCFTNMTNLTSINISEGVTIGNYFMQNCTAITSITIPNATFSNKFLMGCSKLEHVTFGTGVNTISMNTLNDCKSLKWIEFQSTTPPTIESGLIFENTNSNFVIYVPNSSVEAYKSAQNFTTFASRIKTVSERG